MADSIPLRLTIGRFGTPRNCLEQEICILTEEPACSKPTSYLELPALAAIVESWWSRSSRNRSQVGGLANGFVGESASLCVHCHVIFRSRCSLICVAIPPIVQERRSPLSCLVLTSCAKHTFQNIRIRSIDKNNITSINKCFRKRKDACRQHINHLVTLYTNQQCQPTTHPHSHAAQKPRILSTSSITKRNSSTTATR